MDLDTDMLRGHSRHPLTTHPPIPTTRFTIESMTEERVELYWHVLPQGLSILVDVTPFLVVGSVTNKEDFAWMVRRLHLNCF